MSMSINSMINTSMSNPPNGSATMASFVGPPQVSMSCRSDCHVNANVPPATQDNRNANYRAFETPPPSDDGQSNQSDGAEYIDPPIKSGYGQSDVAVNRGTQQHHSDMIPIQGGYGQSDVAVNRGAQQHHSDMVVKVKCPGCMTTRVPSKAVEEGTLQVLNSSAQSISYMCTTKFCHQSFEVPVYIYEKFKVVQGVRDKLRAYRNRHQNASNYYGRYYYMLMMPTILLSATLSIVSAYGGEEEEGESGAWFWARKWTTTLGNAVNTILVALLAMFKFQGRMEQHVQAAKMYESLLTELEYTVEYKMSFVKHAGTTLESSAEYTMIDDAIKGFLEQATARIAEIDGNTPVVPEHLKVDKWGRDPGSETSVRSSLLSSLSCILVMLVNTFFVILRCSFVIITAYLGYRIFKDVEWKHGDLHGLQWYHCMILVSSLATPMFSDFFVYAWQVSMACLASYLTYHLVVDMRWHKFPDFHAMGIQWYHFMVIPAILAAYFPVPQCYLGFVDLERCRRNLLKSISRCVGGGADNESFDDYERGYDVQCAPTESKKVVQQVNTRNAKKKEMVIVGRPIAGVKKVAPAPDRYSQPEGGFVDSQGISAQQALGYGIPPAPYASPPPSQHPAWVVQPGQLQAFPPPALYTLPPPPQHPAGFVQPVQGSILEAPSAGSFQPKGVPVQAFQAFLRHLPANRKEESTPLLGIVEEAGSEQIEAIIKKLAEFQFFGFTEDQARTAVQEVGPEDQGDVLEWLTEHCVRPTQV